MTAPAQGADLTPTDQVPLGAVDLDATDRTVTNLWRVLLDDEGVQTALVNAARAFARGRTAPALYAALDDHDIPKHLQRAALETARGHRGAAWDLVALARGLAESHVGNHFAGVDEIHATAGLFAALENAPDAETPTIAVRVGPEFRDRRRGQREDVLQLLAVLAGGLDVRLVTSRVTRRWLADVHRADLPGVSEWYDARHGGGPVAAVVEDALADLDPDGRAARFLKRLADEPAETLSYAALKAEATVGASRVRQVVGDLCDLDLVETYGPQSDRRVDLLEAGRRVVESLEAEAAGQQTLEESVSGTGKSLQQAVLPTRGREGGEDGEDAAAGRCPFRVRYANRAHHAAAAATAAEGGVTLLEEPATADETSVEERTKYVSHDRGRDEAVVSVRATGGLHYVVSLATALASPRLLSKALPDERLEAVDDPPAILREARCIGALSEDVVDDPAALRETLVEWGEHVESLTTDLQHGEYEDRARFRGEIMRAAHGLAGSVVHMLAAAGVDVVRDVRVAPDLDADHLEDLARTVAISASIQSRYGAFAAYRQLYETDAGRPTFTPTVDAADPVASLIGGFVLRGADVTRLRGPLEDRLKRPGDPQEDAAEFVVRVPVREAGRREFGAAVGGVLSRKNLRPSRRLVSLLHALAPAPFAVSRALLGTLATEATPDGLRADEVRVALSTLEIDHLLPDLPPTVGKVVAALLQADTPLSQQALADAAGVSTRSLRTHRERLEALGLVDVNAAGWRLAVSFPTQEERRDEVLPSATTWTFVEATDAVLQAALPTQRYADPEDPVAAAVFWPPDPWGLIDADRPLSPWVALAGRLAGADPPDDREATVAMGPRVEQQALADAADAADIDGADAAVSG